MLACHRPSRRRPRARVRLAVGAAAVALLAGGCTDPYAQRADTTETARSSPLQRAQRTREWPARPDRHTPTGGAPTAEQAIRDFARRSINWTWRDLADRQQQLAAESLGQARRQAQLMATTAAHDDEMRRGKITHAGSVQAIVPRPGVDGQWLVVTHERSGTEAPGVYESVPPVWRVTIAAAREIRPGRWVVTAWRPQ